MNAPKNRTEHFALALTRWVGSPSSIVVHTILFAGSFALSAFNIVQWERMLLVVTTIVSLEAIYLAIFIQMSLNFANQTIEAVEEDIDEIQKDIDEIQEDVDEIQEDIDEIQEDVDEMEEADEADEARKSAQKVALEEIRTGLVKLMNDVEKLK